MTAIILLTIALLAVTAAVAYTVAYTATVLACRRARRTHTPEVGTRPEGGARGERGAPFTGFDRRVMELDAAPVGVLPSATPSTGGQVVSFLGRSYYELPVEGGIKLVCPFCQTWPCLPGCTWPTDR